MKNICYVVVLCLILGACDKCRDMGCGGYGCNDGECVCPEPFTGSECNEHKYQDMAGVYSGDLEVNSDVSIAPDGKHWVSGNSFAFDPGTDSIIGYTAYQIFGDYLSYIQTNESLGIDMEFRSKVVWRKDGNFDCIISLSYSRWTNCEYVDVVDEVVGIGQFNADSKTIWMRFVHSSDYLYGDENDCEETAMPVTLDMLFTGTMN